MSTPDPEIPARLFQNGRPVDPVFEPDELLYRRCTHLEMAGGRPFPFQTAFYPDWSTNRSKYSEAADVLLGYQGFGVVAFRAGDVPGELRSSGGPLWSFHVTHVPEEPNYAHTEVRTFKEGVHQTYRDGGRPDKMPETVKKEFRTALSLRARIVIHAPAGSSGVGA